MTKPNRTRRSALFTTAAGLLVLASGVLPSSAAAAGAEYYVLKCHDSHRPANEVHGNANGNYILDDQCQGPNARLSITNGGPAVINQGGQYTVTAPPGTTITEVHLDANLRRGSHHLAQVGVWNGSTVQVLMNGPDTDPSWQHADFGGLNHPQLVIRLYCSDGGGCPGDGQAHAYVRNINVKLADIADPSAPSLGGSLLSGAWLRGSQSLNASASDTGAGISLLYATVNGTTVAGGGSCNSEGVGFPSSGLLRPCELSASFNQSLSTAAGPFHDGANTVRIQAVDYPGNAGPAAERTVLVDNTAPSLAFTNDQDPADPELIRAPVSDAASGVGSAKLYMRQVGASDWQPLDTQVDGGDARARVDSLAYPAGDYEFRATASDVAGNSAETAARQDGAPMRLTFPLRTSVQLQSHLDNGASKGQTVPYGTDSKASGRLFDENGEPVTGQQITVVESFGDGALIRERVSHVTTNDKGRWHSKVPAGPTRHVSASFDGTRRYAPRDSRVGKLTVKSRASFRTSRDQVPEGKAVVFKGKVGHFGARIPSGGKLIELQVRLKTGRWQTVRQAFRTKPNGRYRLRYRFGKQYADDALFRFRVKVQKEGNWPYKRGASKQRKVIVRAR